MMKKILFSLLAVFMLVSCGEKTSYSIQGIVGDVADGTQVFFYKDRRGQEVLETTKVKDGKFEFSGEQTEPVIRFVGVEDKLHPQLVIIEAGDIKVELVGEAVKISGTALNEKNTQFWSALGAKGQPDSELLAQFIKENVDNVLGVYYLDRHAYSYNLEELKELLASFPAKYDGNETLERVRNNVKMQEETAVGQKFKDLKSLTPEGKETSLSDFSGKGKVVLVDFWASWCPPCRRDMPHLVELYAKYKEKGFEIVGVSLDKNKEDWVKGIKELNITWPQMSDLKYWDSELSKAYAVRSIPFTVLIDAEGTIIAQRIGGADLEAKLEELLK